MHLLSRLSLAAVLTLSLVACGDDPVSYSQPVTINLKAKSDDTVNNVVEDDKNITTESGNPFAKFVTDARLALGGADPSTIELTATTLTLGAGSTGVLKLGEVFTGNTEVNLTMADTNNTYPAAWGVIEATDGTTVTLETGFDTETLPDTDYAKVLAAGFKVGIRGPAAAGFAAKGADADIQVTLTFVAYE